MSSVMGCRQRGEGCLPLTLLGVVIVAGMVVVIIDGVVLVATSWSWSWGVVSVVVVTT